ncbi:pseudaminic acid synthase [Helicobacter fennelliae]|uniref:Pseudaminic acid synthase n=2 Tax=Helicobacter fennelliae TaxID=215 RepID=A0A2X3BSI9_9HELI|nr:pseudaminic acid synthase [Helicobacter fennelliae]
MNHHTDKTSTHHTTIHATMHTTTARAPKPLIIAELSGNHNQNLNLALQSIQAAKECGADFVKLQTYTPDCLTINAKTRYFQIDSRTIWDGQNLYELYKQACTPFEWHKELFAFAKSIDIGIFSSPFSKRALELLESLNCPMYKIASFEITDLELIALVASTKKPIIISTGIATHNEIIDAIEVCKNAGNDNITLFLCTSSYPAPIADANIAYMPKLAQYGTKYGLSDHTLGDVCAIAATALGANMIEKHFILDRSLGGVDSAFSMDKQEFALMVERVNNAYLALGDGTLHRDERALQSQRKFARSLFVCQDIQKNEILNSENIRSIRPGFGLPPKLLPMILGKKATKNLHRGEPLCEGDFE